MPPNKRLYPILFFYETMRGNIHEYGVPLPPYFRLYCIETYVGVEDI
jgi:hypothetical protein